MIAYLGSVIAALLVAIWLLVTSVFAGIAANYTGSAEYEPCNAAAIRHEQDEAALRRKRPGAFSTVLAAGAARLPFRDTRTNPHFSLHLGQRKLLLAEVEFLTAHGAASDTIVYAGAAPGTHIQMLLDIFPHTFHLYDPREITWQHPRMTAYTQLFTNADAERWAGKKVLFISDIRAGSDDSPDRDSEIEAQMLQQQGWCEIMKPTMASLKFRLSWERKKLEYFSGEIHLQQWAPMRSTETRLWTDCRKKTSWDAVRYDEQMCAHNLIARQQIYDETSLAVPGYDGCWDCLAERRIWEAAGHDPAAQMNAATDMLHQNLDRHNHGKYSAATLEERERLCLADDCICAAA